MAHLSTLWPADTFRGEIRSLISALLLASYLSVHFNRLLPVIACKSRPTAFPPRSDIAPFPYEGPSRFAGGSVERVKGTRHNRTFLKACV